MAESPVDEITGSTLKVESDERDLFMPLFKNGRFDNPWKTWKMPGMTWGSFKFVTSIAFGKGSPVLPGEMDRELPVVKPDMEQFSKSPSSGIRHMWIGHATSLVQFDGLTFLTDPVFSERCAPVQFAGPKRYRPPACSVADLPNIDCVFISHNHYDHLDYNSVVKLNNRFGESLRWYVPMGLKSWMTHTGCKNVVELNWWGEHEYSTELGIKVVATPCQHWSKRTALDTFKTLWSSWCVLGPKHKFYFSGDTGYCEGFTQIGRKYGPFTLATIPIGAYHPRWFLKCQHVNPAEAVLIHKDISAQNSVGIHWGTFRLTLEHYLEPRKLLSEEVEKQGLKQGEFVTVKHGEVRIFGAQESELS